MRSWKKALVIGSLSAGALMLIKGNKTAGVALATVGLAVLAGEYPEKFERVWEEAPDDGAQSPPSPPSPPPSRAPFWIESYTNCSTSAPATVVMVSAARSGLALSQKALLDESPFLGGAGNLTSDGTGSLGPHDSPNRAAGFTPAQSSRARAKSSRPLSQLATTGLGP